jgi:hypothetical protein
VALKKLDNPRWLLFGHFSQDPAYRLADEEFFFREHWNRKLGKELERHSITEPCWIEER